MEEHIRNTWKLLSSENIIFFNCSVVQWTCCLAIAIRCFFTLSVSSAFLAVLPQGSPGDGHALFGMKRFEAALDADFSHPVLLTEVSSRFLSWKSVCSMWSLSSLSTSKLMLWNCIACGSPLAKDKSFIMVNLALLRLHIIFIGIFFYIRQEYEPSPSSILHFPGMLKWYFQKQSPHWWSILNYLLRSKIFLPEWCRLKT